jgi:hypothetical protein
MIISGVTPLSKLFRYGLLSNSWVVGRQALPHAGQAGLGDSAMQWHRMSRPEMRNSRFFKGVPIFSRSFTVSMAWMLPARPGAAPTTPSGWSGGGAFPEKMHFGEDGLPQISFITGN